jgi:hypothetical protein
METEHTTRTSAERVDAALRDERDRLVGALRRLADKIENAPLDRVSAGVTWITTAAETLVTTIERALARDK